MTQAPGTYDPAEAMVNAIHAPGCRYRGARRMGPPVCTCEHEPLYAALTPASAEPAASVPGEVERLRRDLASMAVERNNCRKDAYALGDEVAQLEEALRDLLTRPTDPASRIRARETLARTPQAAFASDVGGRDGVRAEIEDVTAALRERVAKWQEMCDGWIDGGRKIDRSIMTDEVIAAMRVTTDTRALALIEALATLTDAPQPVQGSQGESERLRAELASANDIKWQHHEMVGKLSARVLELEATLAPSSGQNAEAGLREALEPFAELADKLDRSCQKLLGVPLHLTTGPIRVGGSAGSEIATEALIAARAALRGSRT